MALRLYDTLTREKRDFTPINPQNVRMYVCGPTVYDFAHIGNARPVIVFDVLFRLLRHLYGESHVTYVRNITDVDDKINDRAARDYPGLPLNEAIRKVTEQTEKQFQADVDALGCLKPTHQPRATEHIGEMIDIIGRLLENGYAYIAHGPEGREVLFSVEKMPRYGELSHRSLDEQREGARVAVEAHKRNPADFVLWKESSITQPGWPGKFRVKGEYPSNADEIEIFGRPGWHIECSAMSWKYLGETFDLHGGGIDLVFPHHENEIAQSCCAFHTDRMAQTWMHNGFLQVEGEKMSKSLGNFVTIRELLNDWPGEVIRLNMLKTHYRSPIDWTVASLEESRRELQTWANALENTDGMLSAIGRLGINEPATPTQQIVESLSDDLNTPKAVTELRSIFSRIRGRERSASSELMESLDFFGLLRPDKLGLFNPYHVGSGGRIASPDIKEKLDRLQVALANGDTAKQKELIADLSISGVEVSASENGSIEYEVVGSGIDVRKLVEARAAARANKDWKESDRIRDELAAMGVVLKDGKDADGKPVTTWEIAR